MKSTLLLALAALLSLAGVAAADEPKAFACSFTNGVAHSYDKGKFTTEASAPLSFGIAAIDGTTQSAELRTERGTGLLRLVQAVNAMHFLELVTEGFLHVTTIYDKDEAKGLYPAVHSRHFGVLGQAIVTQYQGFCEAKG
jgi:hypothetical protein